MSPRPASEQLVAAALARIGERPARFVDVGTGSGAIAIAIASAAPAAEVWATDTSRAAVALARANVRQSRLADRVTVRHGDLLDPVPGAVDLAVANLPYLSAAARESHPDLADEPPEAVFALGDGLEPYRRLLNASTSGSAPAARWSFNSTGMCSRLHATNFPNCVPRSSDLRRPRRRCSSRRLLRRPRDLSRLRPGFLSSCFHPFPLRRASPHERLEEQMLGRVERLSPRATALTIAFALLGGLAISCGSSSGGRLSSTAATELASSLAPIRGSYSPSIDPANFVATVDNRYWPLTPGTGFHYRGVRGRTPQTDDELVTRQTKRILGVSCTVVQDTVSEHGSPVERTFDWYAQDKQGNVWYMGEDALELQHGHFVKASDSWEAGVNGAKPGIIMPGNPQPGDRYRQEYYPPGQALDQARVLGYSGTVKVPYGTFKRSLVTSEFSPLEPQTEKKYYVAGVGEIEERVVKGHHEQFQLVSVTH